MAKRQPTEVEKKLYGEIESLTAEKERLREKIIEDMPEKTEIVNLIKDYACGNDLIPSPLLLLATERIRELETKFEEYAKHKSNCEKEQTMPEICRSKIKCTCGLEQALQENQNGEESQEKGQAEEAEKEGDCLP